MEAAGHACGAVDHRSRPSQAELAGVVCGHRDHADVSAAESVLGRGAICRQPGMVVLPSPERPPASAGGVVTEHLCGRAREQDLIRPLMSSSFDLLVGPGGCDAMGNHLTPVVGGQAHKSP